MKPPCTCPRDDSGNTNGCELHDSRSDWNRAIQFYDVAVPCESCGRPCEERRYDPEYELWIGTACFCQQPDEPICPVWCALIMQAETVGEVRDLSRAHRLTCQACGGVQPISALTQADIDAQNLTASGFFTNRKNLSMVERYRRRAA